MYKVQIRTGPLFILLIAISFLALNCHIPAAAKVGDAVERTTWQKRLPGHWKLTFQGDPVAHPVTVSLQHGALIGTYQTKTGQLRKLKDLSFVPPHPAPPGVDPERTPIQEDFYDFWRLYFEVPDPSKPIACHFDLCGDKDVLTGDSWPKNMGGKGGTTGATLTRQKS